MTFFILLKEYFHLVNTLDIEYIHILRDCKMLVEKVYDVYNLYTIVGGLLVIV